MIQFGDTLRKCQKIYAILFTTDIRIEVTKGYFSSFSTKQVAKQAFWAVISEVPIRLLNISRKTIFADCQINLICNRIDLTCYFYAYLHYTEIRSFNIFTVLVPIQYAPYIYSFMVTVDSVFFFDSFIPQLTASARYTSHVTISNPCTTEYNISSSSSIA